MPLRKLGRPQRPPRAAKNTNAKLARSHSQRRRSTRRREQMLVSPSGLPLRRQPTEAAARARRPSRLRPVLHHSVAQPVPPYSNACCPTHRSSGRAPACRSRPSFHSGPSTSCRRAPLSSNVGHHEPAQREPFVIVGFRQSLASACSCANSDGCKGRRRRPGTRRQRWREARVSVGAQRAAGSKR